MEREGASAALFVDDEQVANDRVDETEHIQLKAPIYFGGLAKDLHSFTGRLLPVNFKSLTLYNPKFFRAFLLSLAAVCVICVSTTRPTTLKMRK